MNRRLKNKGFSLTEVLLAAGILVIGFMLIAGTLPVGIKLTAIGTERTIGATAADEAFAKVQLFGLRKPIPVAWPADPNVHCVDYIGISHQSFLTSNNIEYNYPSTDIRPDVKKYHWAAMCKYNMVDYGLDTFQVTIFVSRDTGLNTKYPYGDYGGIFSLADYPRPIPVVVQPVDAADNVIAVGSGMWADRIHVLTTGPTDPMGRAITDESVLLDDRTGQIIRVLEREDDPTFVTLEAALFEVDAAPPLVPRYVWVLPPANGSGRYPGVGVYQRTISFK